MMITIEVAYAIPEKQRIIVLDVAPDCTVYEAVEQSNIVQEFPEIDLAQMPMGIFSQLVSDPKTCLLKSGDRVEIYRPLQIDPKESRRARAAKAKQEKLANKLSRRVRTTSYNKKNNEE